MKVLLKPVIIYLDQCAASEIAKEEKWTVLRGLLIKGVELQKLICPMPYETLLESSTCDLPETRARIFRLFSEISGNQIFRQFFQILADELLSLVRPGHTVSFFAATEKIEEMPRLSAAFRTDFCEVKAEVNAGLASWIDPEPEVSRTNQEVLKSVSLEPVVKLWRDLQLILKMTNGAAFPEFECGRITDNLLKRGLTHSEAAELADALRYRKMDAIPIQFFHNRLAAAGVQESPHRVNRKVTYNDLVDQERLSVALDTANMAITDNKMVARIERSGVLEISTCEVYKVGDMQKFQHAIERVLT